MHENPQIAFFGTPGLAASCLEKLLEAFPIALVVTQPDKQSGRGRAISSTPVSAIAERENLPLYRLPSIRSDFAGVLKEHGAGLVVVVAFGRILPEEVILSPERGSLNLHASLLPRYRGASPVQTALLNGEQVTGITVQKMSRKLDAGDILAALEVPIGTGWTAERLMGEITSRAPGFLVDTLTAYLEGEMSPVPQDERLVSYCSVIRKDDGRVDWNEDAVRICNKIRAFNIWPVCHSFLDGKLVRFFNARASALESSSSGKPGEIVALDKREGIVVNTGQGIIGLLELQLENKRRMSHLDFMNGYRNLLGKIFARQ